MHKVVQVTDLHLPSFPDQSLHGVYTEQRWHQVCAHIRAQHADADLLLLTGDLVHHSGAVAYQRLLQDIETLGLDCLWLPGNHDDSEQMLSLGSAELNRNRLRLGSWDILALDTTSEPDGQGSGSLGEMALQRLASDLSDSDAAYVLLAMHHNPVSVKSRWQDAIALADAASFWQGLEPYPRVKAAVFGHVHHAWSLQYQQVQLFSAPAVAAQFKAGCDDMQIETDGLLSGPGYRVYQLHDDGRIEATTCLLET